MRKYVFVAGLAFVWYVAPALADGPSRSEDRIETERVQFQPGSAGASIRGTLKGYQTIDYVLRAKAGQLMRATMVTDAGANYFNILAPGETDVAFFNGSIDNNRFSGKLPATGDYRIRVYQMRSAARRGETARYTLRVQIDGAN